MGEVEGGEGGEGEPGAEGRPVEEGDALPRHLIIIGVRCIKSQPGSLSIISE